MHKLAVIGASALVVTLGVVLLQSSQAVSDEPVSCPSGWGLQSVSTQFAGPQVPDESLAAGSSSPAGKMQQEFAIIRQHGPFADQWEWEQESADPGRRSFILRDQSGSKIGRYNMELIRERGTVSWQVRGYSFCYPLRDK